MSKYIKPPKSEDCVWRSGPPPEIGWWPCDNPRFLRYWDGKYWSVMFHHGMDEIDVSCDIDMGYLESKITTFPVIWTDRWWIK